MPNFYNFRQDGLTYSFDDVFVPADAFRQGNLWVWGYNLYAQLGINNVINPICTPVTTFSGGANWKQVEAGYFCAAAIKTDGTLWTWGNVTFPTSGSLGNNDTVGRCTPVTTFAGGTNWKQVCSRGSNGFGIKTDGTLWTWGSNSSGQIGDNTSINKLTPVTTFSGGTNWKQVSYKIQSVAAIKTDGTLWTWGRNSYGQLGVNDTATRCTPVTTFAGGTNWKQVSFGTYIPAAIKTDGTLWIWGRNDFGQLGINDAGTALYRTTPVTTFAGGTNWKQISGGLLHTTAIKTDGTLWTWGYNFYGQLGVNDTATRCTPVTTFAGGTNWKQVAGGDYHTAAIKTDGTLWTWGSNSSGQIGDNTRANRSTPVTTFAGGNNWKQVACGTYSTLAITYIDDYQ